MLFVVSYAFHITMVIFVVSCIAIIIIMSCNMEFIMCSISSRHRRYVCSNDNTEIAAKVID